MWRFYRIQGLTTDLKQGMIALFDMIVDTCMECRRQFTLIVFSAYRIPGVEAKSVHQCMTLNIRYKL